jgi:hypothetical protein
MNELNWELLENNKGNRKENCLILLLLSYTLFMILIIFKTLFDF